MTENINPQPNSNLTDNSQVTPIQSPTRTDGQEVIQPTPKLVPELQTQQPIIDSSELTQPSQQPPQSYPQPSAAADGQMKIGLSASQMGWTQSQSSRNWKSLLKPLIIAVVLLVVIGGGLLFFKGLSGYGTKTVQGDGFTYSVTFSKLSSTTTINGKPYLQGKDKSGQTMMLNVGKSVESTYDCHTSAGSTISIVATPTIDGSQHNLCYSQTLNAYDMNFTHNNTWYYLTVFPKDKSATLDQGTVKMIANSVSVQ